MLTVVQPGSSGIAIGVSPLTAAGIPGRHTRLVWIVVTALARGRHAPAFVTQRIGIAHQSSNFVGDVGRKGHGNLGWG